MDLEDTDKAVFEFEDRELAALQNQGWLAAAETRAC